MNEFNDLQPGDSDDEAIDEAYFRKIIESEFFSGLTNPDDRDLLLLAIAQSCIQYVADRKCY